MIMKLFKFAALSVLAGAISQTAAAVIPPPLATTSITLASSVFIAPSSVVATFSAPTATTTGGEMGARVSLEGYLVVYQHMDFAGFTETWHFGWGPGYTQFGTCVNLADYRFDDFLTSYRVIGICCNFFDDLNCDENQSLWKANNRQDYWVRGGHNDAVGSIKCVQEC